MCIHVCSIFNLHCFRTDYSVDLGTEPHHYWTGFGFDFDFGFGFGPKQNSELSCIHGCIYVEAGAEMMLYYYLLGIEY